MTTSYYSVINKTLLHSNIKTAGNGAHQVRNYLTGKNNAETPELLIVDQLCAQIENQTRDMLSLIKHNIDIQKSLTNCIRCIKLALRTLSNNDIPSYVLHKINEKEFSLVLKYLKISDKLLQKIGTMIVSALTKKVISDFQLNLKIVDENVNNDEGKDNDNINDIELNFKNSMLDIDKYTLQQPCTEMDNFINISNIMSRNGCNSSHEMQNCAAPFIRTQPQNDIAKQIIGIGGQMENQWRNIQMQLFNFKNQYKTHANVDNLKRNLCNNTKKQIDNIVINLEKISKMRNTIIKFDSIDAIEGSMQVLIAVFRSNFKLQFGL